MDDYLDPSTEPNERTIQDLVYTGFNSRVIALDRYTGEVVWFWRAPRGRASHVSVLLDGDRLVASVRGYMYCLNPLNGQQLWFNPMKGYGYGTASLASIYGNSGSAAAAAVIVQQQQQQQQLLPQSGL